LIGYGALGISGYPGFQQVAVYAASGILISLMLTRFVLPGLVSANKQCVLAIPFVTQWLSVCQRYRTFLLILLLIVLSLSFFNLKSLHWMQDMQQLTPELDYLKQQDRQIRARMTSIEPGRFVMVTGKNIEATLQHAESAYKVLDALKQQGVLTDYYGLYPWLLSAQRQQINHSLLQDYLTEENLVLWRGALKNQGLSIAKLGHFDYTNKDILSLQDVLLTPLKRIVDSRIIVGEQQTIMMIWLAEHKPGALKQALSELEHVQYFSQREMLNHMTQDYTERAKVLLSAGLALIVLLLLWRYKSLAQTMQTLLPSILSAFIIISVWSISGAAISFLHLVGFLLVVAVCVDYGIFYRENRGGNRQLTYQAMAASMLTSALAFASLMTAESTLLTILSSVVTFGVILGFILCPLIIGSENGNKQ
jgi:predicted exporter